MAKESDRVEHRTHLSNLLLGPLPLTLGRRGWRRRNLPLDTSESADDLLPNELLKLGSFLPLLLGANLDKIVGDNLIAFGMAKSA